MQSTREVSRCRNDNEETAGVAFFDTAQIYGHRS